MKKVYVRWLGAFAGRSFSIRDSINFEMNRKDEAACEPVVLSGPKGSLIGTHVARMGQVGLMIRKESIFREFKTDVWSFYGQDECKSMHQAKKDQNPNALYALSYKRCSPHAEAWAKMPDAVTGIVVYRGLAVLPLDKRNAVLKAARKYSLAVYCLTSKGELRREEV